MRLYGSLIALVSGIYSAYLSTTGMRMSGSAWFMFLLGIIVLAHGAVLLTPVARRLGIKSGPMMIVYATLMLLNQAWLASTGIDSGMMSGGMRAAMSWNAGMIAIAVLMLASGVIMTTRKEMMK